MRLQTLISQPIPLLWLTGKKKDRDKVFTEQKAKTIPREFAMNEELSNSSSSPLNFRCLPSYNIQDILYPSPSVSDPSFDAECALECSHPHPHQHYPPQLGSASVHNTPRDGDHSIISSSANLGILFIQSFRLGWFEWVQFQWLLQQPIKFQSNNIYFSSHQHSIKKRVRNVERIILCNISPRAIIVCKYNNKNNKGSHVRS